MFAFTSTGDLQGFKVLDSCGFVYNILESDVTFVLEVVEEEIVNMKKIPTKYDQTGPFDKSKYDKFPECRPFDGFTIM